ncbi:phage head spike fiber domain-containing protein [Thalassorhabdomicrobium marinisediminis]|uniref:phage head spike fiber domain-containing protein n=1 Tax=Thalassorhabdomicrobium marinisediminis TaxID=2170577 RepID=UPI0024917416|nr:hypothetical protein [Thalassorhabdomicrobium marinisediminis]
MFQDAAGTNPVTAGGDPVGLIQDKSGNGNHLSQAVDEARPVYAIEPVIGRRNLLTRTEDLSHSDWVKGGVTTLTANKISATTSSNAGIYQTFIKPDGETEVTVSFDVKLETMLEADFTFAIYNASDGAFVEKQIASPIALSTSEFRRITYTVTVPSASKVLRFYPYRADTGTSASLFIKRCQVETGGTATSYQKVTNTYDVTETGVHSQHWLESDEVDDKLESATNYGNPAGFSFSVAGKFSATSGERVIAGLQDTVGSRYNLLALVRADGLLVTYVTFPDNTQDVATHDLGFSNGDDFVLSAGWDNGSASFHLNGVEFHSTTGTTGGLGGEGSKLCLGYDITDIRRSGLTIYGAVISDEALSDADRGRVESYLARKSGVTL